MWSKTKQALESRLAEELKDRVKYNYAVFRRDGKCRTTCQVLSILVDGESWFHTNQRFWDEKYKTRPEPEDNDIIRETGLVENYWGGVMEFVHQYLNVLSIEESISHENYFIRLLAVLDARLGKRKIKELVDNIDNEPEWFRKWILLRAGAAASESPRESPLEVATLGWPVFAGVRYRVSVDGIRTGDCRIPHVHLDRADDLERKEFAFEISLAALLATGEPALVRQKDARTRIDRAGEDCSWNGYERLRDGVLAYFEAAPDDFAPRGSRSNLESAVILWNKESGANPNRLSEYLEEHRIKVLGKYRCFFPAICTGDGVCGA